MEIQIQESFASLVETQINLSIQKSVQNERRAPDGDLGTLSFTRTAGAVRSQLNNYSARHYACKANEMTLPYRSKVYDRGTWWLPWEARGSKCPLSGHAWEASWRMAPWRCAVRKHSALARRVCVGGVFLPGRCQRHKPRHPGRDEGLAPGK